MVGHRIAGRSAVYGHVQLVPGRLLADDERAVVGPVPQRVRRAQVEVELVAAVLRQQVEAVVAEPEVVGVVAEAGFEGAPGVVESIDDTVTGLHHYRRTIE